MGRGSRSSRKKHDDFAEGLVPDPYEELVAQEAYREQLVRDHAEMLSERRQKRQQAAKSAALVKRRQKLAARSVARQPVSIAKTPDVSAWTLKDGKLVERVPEVKQALPPLIEIQTVVNRRAHHVIPSVETILRQVEAAGATWRLP